MPAACSYQRGARSSAISFYKFAIMQSTSQAGAQGGPDACRQELPTRCAGEDSPKRAPRKPKRGPREPKTAPREPKTAQESPRQPQENPRKPQDSAKTAPREPKPAPRQPKRAPGSKIELPCEIGASCSSFLPIQCHSQHQSTSVNIPVNIQSTSQSTSHEITKQTYEKLLF